MDEDYLLISGLQHFAYCPRQFALIHIEQQWEENRFTAEGHILHERVDSGESEQRRNCRYERGVMIQSEKYRLTGKMDLLEVENAEAIQYRPVEYKRGKPKVEDWDRIQLCAQALCIEEMRNIDISEGAIWYWQIRQRETVPIDKALRDTTMFIIESAHRLLQHEETPPPVEDIKRCRACSLVSACHPHRFSKDHSARYVKEMFES